MPQAQVKENTRKVNLPVMTRTATVEPSSLNIEKRTVDIVWTTKKGSRVLRQRFFSEDFHEELGLEKKNVRMGRLESGTAPFLDQHGFTDKAGVRSAIGVIENAELIEGKEGRATIRFSKRDEVEEIFQDVKDGILSNVSVGYNVFRFMELEETAPDGLKIMRAVDWEPVEISLVTAGADPHAKIRSNDDADTTECVFEQRENKTEVKTETKTKTETRTASPTEPEIVEPKNEKVATPENLRDTQSIGDDDMTQKEIDEARKEATQAEKTRQTEIRSVVAKVGLDEKLATEYIEADKTVDEVRTLVIDELAAKDKKPETQTRAGNPEVTVGEDIGRKSRIAGMTSALLHKYRPKDLETVDNGRLVVLPGYALADEGREYAYLSLAEMARTSLEAQGLRTGSMPKHRFIDIALNNVRDSGGLHSISDFPEILANVVNKTLRGGYQAAPQTWKPFTNEVFVADFKEISRTNLGDAPKLLKVGENSEVKRGSLSEAAEKYRVEEFARIVGITRKVIVNDDLAAFTRLPERMGRRAADLESDLVWDIIKANAAMSDALALFSAGHGNLSASPAAPSEAGLAEGRKLMRRQVGLDGAEIALTPIWIFVPPEHETAAEKLIASIVPDSSTNVSPFSSAGRTPLRLDVEPRLETGTGGSTDAWFMTADKGQVDMIELARLEGTDGPQTQTRDGFDIAGMEIKIGHDLGAKSIDHRGLFKNAGA